MKLPSGQRKNRCKMVETPGVMLEISKPSSEPAAFDGNGLPVAGKEGHGLGVQSISAFCMKHGAVCHFEQDDGWFRLRLML
mgnify:FL=1